MQEMLPDTERETNAASLKPEAARPMPRLVAGPGWLGRLVARAMADGCRVVAPRDREGMILYGEIVSVDDIASGAPMPLLSLKELFLDAKGVFVLPHAGSRATPVLSGRTRVAETLVLGCRPCETAAVAVMDAFFGWNRTNEGYLARREHATLVSFACEAPDAHCFCSSVGGGQSSGEGADLLVSRLPGGDFLLLPQTARGMGVVRKGGGRMRELGREQRPPRPADPPAKFDLATVRGWLAAHCREELWRDFETRCTGCGVCRFVCPTCHCFEMADAVNWCCSGGCWSRDCCALSLFKETCGAGGEPRLTPSLRWWQWLLHKFVYVPESFGRLGCVGCGRCVRTCGAGESLVRVLQRVEEAARAAANQG